MANFKYIYLVPLFFLLIITLGLTYYIYKLSKVENTFKTVVIKKYVNVTNSSDDLVLMFTENELTEELVVSRQSNFDKFSEGDSIEVNRYKDRFYQLSVERSFNLFKVIATLLILLPLIIYLILKIAKPPC